jgi:serine/threonine-protein kinase
MTKSSDDPLIGQTLANFRIDKLLGRGGMAAVYYGWDIKLERPVAIKIIDARIPENLPYAKRLVAEAKAVARWRHENINQVYYTDQQDGLYYFTMEYLSGIDLGQIMSRYFDDKELMPPADVIRIGRAIASALDYAHAHGVIHRDVKPGNVMFTSEGRIVLMDFGMAMNIRQGTLGEAFGTPYYIPPEQARSSAEAVPQSDVYSLAVILFEMLTGSVPFDDPSPVNLALMHLYDTPPLPTSINPAINIPTEAVLLKALSKDPVDRYQTATALMDAIEGALEAGPSPFVEPNDPAIVPVSEYMVAEKVASELEKRPTLPGPPSKMEPPRQRAMPKSTVAPLPVVKRPEVRPKKESLWRRLPIFRLVSAGISLVVIFVIVGGIYIVASGVDIWGTVGEMVPLETVASPTSVPIQILPAPTDGPPTTQPEQLTATPAGPAVLPTILYPDGYQLVLSYTERGFYLRNPGDVVIDAERIAFQSLNSAGEPIDVRFDGKTWAQLLPKIEGGRCDMLEIARTAAYLLRPPECLVFNAQKTTQSHSSEVFWLPTDQIAAFRVLWDQEEIGRCDLASRGCVVYVPLE